MLNRRKFLKAGAAGVAGACLFGLRARAAPFGEFPADHRQRALPGDVLAKKNARVSFEQVIRELEPTQDTLWSPVVLNGSGLGVLANHSLVMASHISRTSAAINDMRRLLTQG